MTSITSESPSRRAQTAMWPGSIRDANPCRSEFSTSGCTTSSGTRAAAASGVIVTLTSSRSPKRTRWMSRYARRACSLFPRAVVCRRGVEQMAEQIAEAREQAYRAGIVAGPHQRRDAVKTVEQEVRLQPRSQRVESCSGELRLEARSGHLPFAILAVERNRLPRRDNRRIDEQLQVHPATDVGRQHRRQRLFDRQRQRHERIGDQEHAGGMEHRERQRQREMTDQKPLPAKPIEIPLPAEPPDQHRHRRPCEVGTTTTRAESIGAVWP